MPEKEEKGQMRVVKNSFKGASKLSVAQPESKRSFKGAVNLRPTPTPTQRPAPPLSQYSDIGKKK